MAGMELPYFKSFAAETLSDSRFQAWDISERGAFWTLINIQWREGHIPGDLSSLSKILKVDSGTMRSLWSSIGDRFIPHPDHPGKLANPRMEQEREEALASLNQKRKAGKLGADSRWARAKQQNGGAIAPLSEPDAEPVAPGSDQIRSAQSNSDQPSQTGEDPWLAGFRTKLAARLGLPEMDIGKDKSNVLSVFREQLAAVGEEMLLNDCAAVARKSANGVPTSLAWFVGWLKRLPTTGAQA